ncbi:hypothetical protein CPB83DRAFT_630486 [Crepidotus variabilis]|uniref:Uncharacterized protein n=1 Tax=Crepidotus variabilis TaxID=179855 RepID=A0A9P6EMN6_9AGAR|nr:hypothetical protein CPB83DRAFT_630486 [Crepidotus variabilis]
MTTTTGFKAFCSLRQHLRPVRVRNSCRPMHWKPNSTQSVSKVIQTSLLTKPEFTTKLKEPDPFVSSNRHILVVDLDANSTDHHAFSGLDPHHDEALELVKSEAFRAELETLREEQPDLDPTTRYVDNCGVEVDDAYLVYEATNEMLARRLRRLVAADRDLPKDAQIDAVVIGPDPGPTMWRALDGLSPKHLEISAGWDESIDADTIDTLARPWDNLESLTLRDNGDGWMGQYPEFFTRIKSLTLEYCAGFDFIIDHVPADAKNMPLQMINLKAVGNDAMGALCGAVEHVPGFSGRLQRLYLTSNRSNYDCSTGDFRESLKQCTAISDLFLALGNPPNYNPEFTLKKSDNKNNDTKLTWVFPQSVESLSFHCSTSDAMLADLDVWIDASSRNDWLPKLKNITIRTDGPEHNALREVQEGKPSAERRKLFQHKIDKIYANLRAIRWSSPVTISP